MKVFNILGHMQNRYFFTVFHQFPESLLKTRIFVILAAREIIFSFLLLAWKFFLQKFVFLQLSARNKMTHFLKADSLNCHFGARPRVFEIFFQKRIDEKMIRKCLWKIRAEKEELWQMRRFPTFWFSSNISKVCLKVLKVIEKVFNHFSLLIFLRGFLFLSFASLSNFEWN